MYIFYSDWQSLLGHCPVFHRYIFNPFFMGKVVQQIRNGNKTNEPDGTDRLAGETISWRLEGMYLEPTLWLRSCCTWPDFKQQTTFLYLLLFTQGDADVRPTGSEGRGDFDLRGKGAGRQEDGLMPHCDWKREGLSIGSNEERCLCFCPLAPRPPISNN